MQNNFGDKTKACLEAAEDCGRGSNAKLQKAIWLYGQKVINRKLGELERRGYVFTDVTLTLKGQEVLRAIRNLPHEISASQASQHRATAPATVPTRTGTSAVC